MNKIYEYLNISTSMFYSLVDLKWVIHVKRMSLVSNLLLLAYSNSMKAKISIKDNI